MNAPEGITNFVPKQALNPSPQLYNKLTSDYMENLAKSSLMFIPSIETGSVINDNGCGTGACSADIMATLKTKPVNISIKGTDVNREALEIYRKRAREDGWPAEAVHMDSNCLRYNAATFTHTIASALLFVLPNNSINAVKKIHRTLKPGGTAIFNSWAYIPNMPPIEATRPAGTPSPRAGKEKWWKADFLQSVVEQGGFQKDHISMHKDDVYMTAPELDRYATMFWSFIGSTTPVGWLESDERNWEKAVGVVNRELKKTDGYTELPDGKIRLKFVANIAVATK